MGSVKNDGERPERNKELRRREAKALRGLRQGAQPEAKVERLVADMHGPAALPRKDGELVFNAPWESRAFGIAVSLYKQGVYQDWGEFRSRLIAEIAAWECHNRDYPSEWNYYERWFAALERLLVEKGLLSKEEIDGRTAKFASGARDEVHSRHSP